MMFDFEDRHLFVSVTFGLKVFVSPGVCAEGQDGLGCGVLGNVRAYSISFWISRFLVSGWFPLVTQIPIPLVTINRIKMSQ
jgi:hypothetical protein